MPELPSVLILYNLPDTTDNKWSMSTFGEQSVEGVIDEVKVVASALEKLGTRYRVVGVRKLSDIPVVLASAREQVIWNLVEGLIGDPQDASLVPVMCSAYGKTATGCDSLCLTLTLDKWRAKAVLRDAEVPVPGGALVRVGETFSPEALGKGPFIVKPAETDASEGIGSDSVFQNAGPGMKEAVSVIHKQFRQPALIEQYVGNREFNVSLVQNGKEIKIMPVAEIDFSAFAQDKPKIIDYAAKWLPESFEYNNTPRVIPALISEEVAERIRAVSLKVWRTLGCIDFARVDLRMDEANNLYILEVNGNPDISPDAGFAAALNAGSIPFEDFVSMMIGNAMDRLRLRASPRRKKRSQETHPGEFNVRYTIAEDREAIVKFTENTGYFRPDEIVIACEVLDEALTKGPGGHYQSFTAVSGGKPVGWICFGPTPCTLGTYDIYWIVVSSAYQRKGIGRALIRHAEAVIAERYGRLSIIETSGKEMYEATREFYLTAGYIEVARVPHFYATDDDKIIYAKRLNQC